MAAVGDRLPGVRPSRAPAGSRRLLRPRPRPRGVPAAWPICASTGKLSPLFSPESPSSSSSPTGPRRRAAISRSPETPDAQGGPSLPPPGVGGARPSRGRLVMTCTPPTIHRRTPLRLAIAKGASALLGGDLVCPHVEPPLRLLLDRAAWGGYEYPGAPSRSRSIFPAPLRSTARGRVGASGPDRDQAHLGVARIRGPYCDLLEPRPHVAGPALQSLKTGATHSVPVTATPRPLLVAQAGRLAVGKQSATLRRLSALGRGGHSHPAAPLAPRCGVGHFGMASCSVQGPVANVRMVRMADPTGSRYDEGPR